MYHAAMGAMQGQGPQEIYDRISDLLMDMQKAQWVRIDKNIDRY
jgi:major membrane immunogen (membrane-anchored lipoprotein)